MSAAAAYSIAEDFVELREDTSSLYQDAAEALTRVFALLRSLLRLRRQAETLARKLGSVVGRLTDDVFDGLSDQEVEELCDRLAEICTGLDQLEDQRHEHWAVRVIWPRDAIRTFDRSRDAIEDFVEAQMLSRNSAFKSLVQERIAEVETLYEDKEIESRCPVA